MRGGAITGRPPTLFLGDSGTPLPSVDNHLSWRWRARNVTKWLGEGTTGGARPGKHSGHRLPEDGLGNRCSPRWTIGRHHGRMGTQNGRQQPGLRRHGAPVETGMRSPTRRRVWVTPGPSSHVAGWLADISVIFLVPYRGRLKWPYLHFQANAVA